jgi:predicted TIM-barrel fold metal-dependent hydrolase
MSAITVTDGDGHIMEDGAAIAEYLPSLYKGGRRGVTERLFPPLDHLHAHVGMLPPEAGGGGKPVGPTEWLDFMEFTRIRRTVLYPTQALAYGRIVNLDWASAVCRAYNDWLYETYMRRDERFNGMALVPLQEPGAAVAELRRAVTELGFKGAMLPTNGMKGHLGGKEYWPIYEEAASLGCAIATHGGSHIDFGLDHMNVYAGAHALGHPFGTMISFAGIVLNGLFDKFDTLRVAFLEGGVAWFLLMLERLDRSYETHVPYDPRGELLRLRDGERVSDYVKRKIKEGQIFVGCEGEEPLLPQAVELTGEEAWLFSSDFPHEVTPAVCVHEIEEVMETDRLTASAKEGILGRNAERFYALAPLGAAQPAAAG